MVPRQLSKVLREVAGDIFVGDGDKLTGDVALQRPIDGSQVRYASLFSYRSQGWRYCGYVKQRGDRSQPNGADGEGP